MGSIIGDDTQASSASSATKTEIGTRETTRSATDTPKVIPRSSNFGTIIRYKGVWNVSTEGELDNLTAVQSEPATPQNSVRVILTIPPVNAGQKTTVNPILSTAVLHCAGVEADFTCEYDPSTNSFSCFSNVSARDGSRLLAMPNRGQFSGGVANLACVYLSATRTYGGKATEVRDENENQFLFAVTTYHHYVYGRRLGKSYYLKRMVEDENLERCFLEDNEKTRLPWIQSGREEILSTTPASLRPAQTHSVRHRDDEHEAGIAVTEPQPNKAKSGKVRVAPKIREIWRPWENDEFDKGLKKHGRRWKEMLEDDTLRFRNGRKPHHLMHHYRYRVKLHQKAAEEAANRKETLAAVDSAPNKAGTSEKKDHREEVFAALSPAPNKASTNEEDEESSDWVDEDDNGSV